MSQEKDISRLSERYWPVFACVAAGTEEFNYKIEIVENAENVDSLDNLTSLKREAERDGYLERGDGSLSLTEKGKELFQDSSLDEGPALLLEDTHQENYLFEIHWPALAYAFTTQRPDNSSRRKEFAERTPNIDSEAELERYIEIAEQDNLIEQDDRPVYRLTDKSREILREEEILGAENFEEGIFLYEENNWQELEKRLNYDKKFEVEVSSVNSDSAFVESQTDRETFLVKEDLDLEVGDRIEVTRTEEVDTGLGLRMVEKSS